MFFVNGEETLGQTGCTDVFASLRDGDETGSDLKQHLDLE